ncbi:hypothetical protein BJX99DRAFT_247965 [Aspergillus californicus]
MDEANTASTFTSENLPISFHSPFMLCPRSFLFVIVANVSPGSASRSLAVAYYQGNHYINEIYFERVDYFVADTLALTKILSDPASCAPLEVEGSLAEDWYQGGSEPYLYQRPSVLDLVQVPWKPWYKRTNSLQYRPQLPWHDNALTEFPLVVLDISNLNNSVKYSIAAFHICYMAEWLHRYYNYNYLNYIPNYRCLDDILLVDAAALDCMSVFTLPVC